MSYKKILVARIYSENNQLVGCGIYSTRTKRTECKAIKDIVDSLNKNEISNMKLSKQGQIEGKTFGAQEFNCITAVRVHTNRQIEVIDSRIMILSFDNNKQYSIIKPDGGVGVMSDSDIKDAVMTGKVKPSNFKIENGKIKSLTDNSAPRSQEDLYSIGSVADYVAEIIAKETRSTRACSNVVELDIGYNLILEASRKCNGVQVELKGHVGIQKYATPEDFRFISQDWGGTGHIDRNLSPQEYDKTLNKRKNEFSKCSLTLQGIENTYEKYYLSLGDKNWLSANHYIKFDIPIKLKDGYSISDIKAVASIILKLIGRG